jgi:hypothetical protein
MCLKIWYEKKKKKKKKKKKEKQAQARKQNIENIDIASNSTPTLI